MPSFLIVRIEMELCFIGQPRVYRVWVVLFRLESAAGESKACAPFAPTRSVVLDLRDGGFNGSGVSEVCTANVHDV